MKLNQSVQCLISIAKNHVLVCFGIVFGQNQGELPAMLLYCNLLQSYGNHGTFSSIIYLLHPFTSGDFP